MTTKAKRYSVTVWDADTSSVKHRAICSARNLAAYVDAAQRAADEMQAMRSMAEHIIYVVVSPL